MSFWAGLARAYKDVDEKNEREDAAEAQEARYQSEVDRAQTWRTEDREDAAAARAADLAMRADELAESRRRWEAENNRADTRLTLEVDESIFNRNQAILTTERDATQWQTAFDYNAGRDRVGDERWAADQIRIADESEEARRQWQAEFEFTTSEADVAADRWRQQFGFQQERALTEDNWRDALQLYAVSRDAVSDTQWNSQFDYTQAQSEAAETRWRATHQLALDAVLTDEQRYEAEMDWRKTQADTASEQWAAGYELDVSANDRANEQVLIDRADQLIALGAGTPGGSDSAPSPADGVAAVQAIRSELEGVGGLDSLSETNQEFFNTMLGNPAAAAGVMSFVLEQREAGNAFEITRLPEVINIVGVVEARGEEAYNTFKRNFAEGNVDLSDPEAYLDAVRALRGYEPSEVLFVQSGPVRNIQDQERMFKAWEMATLQAANAELAGMDRESPGYLELHAALKDLESSNSAQQARGRNNLWATYGRSAADMLGLDNSNTYLKPYFANDAVAPAATGGTPVVEPTVVEPTVADPVVDPVVDPMVDPVVEEPTTDPYAAHPEVDRDLFFDTPDEALELMNTLPDDVKASIEFVVIGGEKFANNLYQGPAQEPTVEEPTVEDPAVEPVDEATRQLNAVLEGEGIDPGEFQRFITQVDEVEGFQDMTDYESLITVFQRMKAQGQEWPAPEAPEAPAPEAPVLGSAPETPTTTAPGGLMAPIPGSAPGAPASGSAPDTTALGTLGRAPDMDLAPSGQPIEPSAEIPIQLNVVLEEEGIDPAEFQEFIDEVGGVEAYQDLDEYEFFITTFKRIKAREEAPAGVEPEVDAESEATAAAEAKAAELTLQLNTRLEEEGIDPDEFQRFLAEADADAAFQATPDFSPDFFIRIFNRSKARGDSF